MRKHPEPSPRCVRAQVLDYLARYTHRVAISNDRILGIDDGQIRLRVRASPDQRRRIVSLPAQDFIARFMRHVLPRGFKRIRHYGLLAPRHKGERLARARAALQVPEPQAPAIETAQAFLRRVSSLDLARCPHCQCGRWRTVEIYAPQPPSTPAPGSRTTWMHAHCLKRPDRLIQARPWHREHEAYRADGAIEARHLIQKNEPRHMKASEAIQQTSPAYRILNITA